MRIASFGLIVLVGVIAISGCAGPQGELFGEEITEKKVTKIVEILGNKDQYIGKTVRMEGKIESECPAGCWLNLQDDTGMLYIDLMPSQLAIPQKVGKQVILQGEVIERSGQPIIHGTGVRVL